MKISKSQKSFRCTSKEFSKKFKVSYNVAYHMLSSLAELGVVVHVGEQMPLTAKRGIMPSKLYEVPMSITMDFEQ